MKGLSVRQPFSYASGRKKLSAAEITLIAAYNKYSGQKDAYKQIFFRQKQGEKNADADPEQDKPYRSLHKERFPPFLY